MAAAVFRTKFAAPTLAPHHRPRPRLCGIWDHPSPRLLTVTAGPGWGKTALLAERARDLGDRALWYSLDELDRDPGVLTAHLLAACGEPASDAPPLEQLAAIVGGLEHRSLLILDDVHVVAQAPATRELLTRLLRYLPSSCNLALAGREPVDLEVARLGARGEVAHLTADDLSFTRDEAHDWLTHRLGPAATADLTARIHTICEGWPTGMAICGQALADAAPDLHPEVLQRLEAGDGRWFDLFSEEVLDGLDRETRLFLLRSSVLTHVDAAACDQLLERRDSGRLLADLASRGFFLNAVGQQSWRYHNLMRRCLQRRLAAELPANDRRRLHRRAADLLASQGEPEAAIHDLVRAGDDVGAVSLLTRHARTLLASRRPETLTLALADLPDRTVRAAAAALLVRADLAQLRGDWDNAEADLRLALRRPAAGWLAGAARARLVRLHLQRGQLERCLALGRRTLDRRPLPAGADRGLILSSLGVAAASLGRLDQGAHFLDQALRLARRRGDRELEGRCLYLVAANIHYVRGDMDAALRDARHARDLYRELGRRDLACHVEGVVGFVLAGCGRVGEARESTRWAQQRADAIGYRLISAYTRLVLGMCELLAGDPAGALAWLHDAADRARTLGEPELETWVQLAVADAAWRQGDHAQARSATRRGLDLATTQHNPFGRARALARLGRFAEARRRGSGAASWQEADRLLRRLGADLEHDRLRLWRAEAGHGDVEAVRAELATSGRGFLIDPAGPADVATPAATATSADTPPLHVRLLGILEIDGGEQRLLAGAWRSRRARRLFNLLILSRGRSLPRERVMEVMWPEAEPRKAAQNLRQSVLLLRRELEPRGSRSPRHVLVEGEALRLDLGPDGTCDLDQFDGALQAALRARRAGRAADEERALALATSLWRGPVLADTPYDPEVDDACAVLRHRFLRAAERLLDLHAAQRRWDDAIALAQRALAEDPLHEPFMGHLLRGLLAVGHRGEARAAYARFSSQLVRELDLLPSELIISLGERASGVQAS